MGNKEGAKSFLHCILACSATLLLLLLLLLFAASAGGGLIGGLAGVRAGGTVCYAMGCRRAATIHIYTPLVAQETSGKLEGGWERGQEER